jgi:hypothetical protein
MSIVAIDKNQVIPTLEAALARAKHGEVTHAYIVICIDGEIETFMAETDSKYEDAGILMDLMLERLGYMPADSEDDGE